MKIVHFAGIVYNPTIVEEENGNNESIWKIVYKKDVEEKLRWV